MGCLIFQAAHFFKIIGINSDVEMPCIASLRINTLKKMMKPQRIIISCKHKLFS